MNRRRAIHQLAATAAGLGVGARVVRADSSSGREDRVSGGPLRVAPGQGAPETLVRGGRIVNADGSLNADLRIVGDTIIEVGPDLVDSAEVHIIDATGCLVIPGGIDPHTHMQGSFVDDLTTGTAAAVAGGITTVGTFAYPRDGEPAVEAMERCLAEVSASAIGDVFLHGFTWPPSTDFASMMPELAASGQPSHKIFMTQSDFGQHRSTLIEVLEAARDAGVVTLMHYEDGAMLEATLRRLRQEGRTALRHYAESRPEIAEIAATQEAVALCELTGAPMHLVHLSSARALDAARTPSRASLPLSIETRPLYLYFTDDSLLGEDGPLYVGQPPLRSAADLDAMWRGLADGRIDSLATDHAPWMRVQKMDPELDVGRLRPGVSDLRFMRAQRTDLRGSFRRGHVDRRRPDLRTVSGAWGHSGRLDRRRGDLRSDARAPRQRYRRPLALRLHPFRRLDRHRLAAGHHPPRGDCLRGRPRHRRARERQTGSKAAQGQRRLKHVA